MQLHTLSCFRQSMPLPKHCFPNGRWSAKYMYTYMYICSNYHHTHTSYTYECKPILLIDVWTCTLFIQLNWCNSTCTSMLPGPEALLLSVGNSLEVTPTFFSSANFSFCRANSWSSSSKILISLRRHLTLLSLPRLFVLFFTGWSLDSEEQGFEGDAEVLSEWSLSVWCFLPFFRWDFSCSSRNLLSASNCLCTTVAANKLLENTNHVAF